MKWEPVCAHCLLAPQGPGEERVLPRPRPGNRQVLGSLAVTLVGGTALCARHAIVDLAEPEVDETKGTGKP